MTNDERADFILEHRMGFPPTATGPYVTALRALVRKQVANGMTNRSGGSWDTENHPDIWQQHEERARCILEWDWEIEHGHSCRVELVDSGPINKRFDTDTMRWYWRFRPQLIRPWIADRCRSVWMTIRVWWDRGVMRRRNPYST